MNPRIESIAGEVGTLTALRDERRRIEVLERACIERIRERVGVADIDAIRETFGAVLTPAVVHERIDPMPLTGAFYRACHRLRSWPLRAKVERSPGLPFGDFLDLVGRCWPDHAILDVALTPLLVDAGGACRHAEWLHAVPTPTVQRALRESGLLPNNPRLELRVKSIKGADDGAA